MSKAREIAELGDVLTVSGSNVGIGTSSPSQRLSLGKSVAYSSDSALYVDMGINDAAVNNNAVYSWRTGLTGNDTGHSYTFSTLARSQGSYVERMRINSDGNLLVGTTSSVYATPSKVEVLYVGSAKFGSNWKTTTADGVPHNFVNSSGTRVGYIYCNATSTSYNTSSDYRLKTDAQPMTGASARVQALNPVNFEWIADGTRVDGFLAHEAQEVVPEAVTGTKDAMRDEEYEVTPAVLDDDGAVVTEAVMGTRSVPEYQGIDQAKLVPLLTAALQEALTKIDDMETRLAALEAV